MIHDEEKRPLPNSAFVEEFAPYNRLIPATGVWQWGQWNIIAESGYLHNPDHIHLADADVGFLWAAHAFSKSTLLKKLSRGDQEGAYE